MRRPFPVSVTVVFLPIACATRSGASSSPDPLPTASVARSEQDPAPGASQAPFDAAKVVAERALDEAAYREHILGDREACCTAISASGS